MRYERAERSFYGIDNKPTNALDVATVRISSQHTMWSAEISTYVLHKITSFQPQSQMNSFSVAKNIKLADPEFYKPERRAKIKEKSKILSRIQNIY